MQDPEFIFLRFLVIGTQCRNFIPTPGWSIFWVGIQFLPTGWSIRRIFHHFDAIFLSLFQFHEFSRHFDEFFSPFIVYFDKFMKLIVCIPDRDELSLQLCYY